MDNKSLEDHARDFATAAHAGQVRRYTGVPYITHPESVVAIVRSRPSSAEMVAAAWLHDVVEDTPVTIETIRLEFGETVASLVADLTDVSQPEDGNRQVRKAMDRDHTAKASPDAKTIKLADLIDNTRSIIVNDPAFAKTYLAEKRALLEVLREGDPVLWQTAFELSGVA